jgi:hypothetical protein
MVFSVTSPSRHFSTDATTWSNCEPCPSISLNTLQASSCTCCKFCVTSITFPWRVVIYFCTMCFSWDLFILSMTVSSFIYTCKENACCCASYNCASIFLSFGSSERRSYFCVLLSLSFLHSKVRDLILTTVFL